MKMQLAPFPTDLGISIIQSSLRSAESFPDPRGSFSGFRTFRAQGFDVSLALRTFGFRAFGFGMQGLRFEVYGFRFRQMSACREPHLNEPPALVGLLGLAERLKPSLFVDTPRAKRHGFLPGIEKGLLRMKKTEREWSLCSK